MKSTTKQAIEHYDQLAYLREITRKVSSIKRNVQFFAWIIIISFILSLGGVILTILGIILTK